MINSLSEKVFDTSQLFSFYVLCGHNTNELLQRETRERKRVCGSGGDLRETRERKRERVRESGGDLRERERESLLKGKSLAPGG